MLGFLRDVICSTVFHAALLYATNIALQQRVRTTDSKGRPGRVRLDIRALKLWIMIMSIAAVSALGADAIPLFTEAKIIIVFLLVLAPPFTQQELYDRAFAPFIESAATAVKSVTSSNYLVHRGGWWATNACVQAAVGITNVMRKRGALSMDEVRDIQSGLTFTQRALLDVKHRYTAQQPEEYVAAPASLWGGNTTNVYATSPQSTDAADDASGARLFSSYGAGSTFGKAEVYYSSSHYNPSA